MSFLNPFHKLFETKEYPHARTLRTTFGQKVSDTFWVYFGGINLLAKDPTNGRILNIELSKSDKKLPAFQLVLGSRKDDQLFKSLRHLNIGRLQAGLELEQPNTSNSL